LPNVCYYDSTGQDYGFTKPYSEERAKVIDQEISALIQEQYERAKVMLKQYAEGHAQLTQVLMEREVIFTEDVEHIFGARPWASRSEEIMQDQQSGASSDDETPAAQSTPQEPSTTDTASH
jgi:cell division protease FtsH